MKSFTYFKSQIYGQWSPTNKIFFWLSISSVIIGIFFGGKYIITINKNYTIVSEKLYSEIQTVTNSIDDKGILYLDSIGTLTSSIPRDDKSITMVLNSITVKHPPNENGTVNYSHKYSSEQIYFFDIDNNKSQFVTVQNRTFVVTLQKIKYLNEADYSHSSTTLKEFQYEYQFGISEVKK